MFHQHIRTGCTETSPQMPWLPNWPLYLIEAALLGTFMFVACATCIAMLHPSSPIARRLKHPLLRRLCIGTAMGTTAVLLITSPFGQLSGAHMNPAVTLAFAALGKLDPRDAAGYILFQFLGGIGGVAIARLLLGRAVAHSSVRFVTTEPGPLGPRIAFIAELTISFVLFAVVLLVSNSGQTAAFTPVAAGILVTLFITFEAPFSGMSMNPARTLGSAVMARRLQHLPIYFAAPSLGMLAAAGTHAAVLGRQSVHCAKLDHRGAAPCPFHCTFDALRHHGEESGISQSQQAGMRNTRPVR